MRKIFLSLLCFLAAGTLLGGVVSNDDIMSGGIGYSANYDTNLLAKKIDSASVQVIYSSVTCSTTTFTNGKVSWNILTVSASGPGNVGHSITINGITVKAGVDFSTGANTEIEARNMRDAINVHSTLSLIVFSSHSLAVITSSAIVAGVNAYAVTSTTTSWTWGAATFSSGTASDIDLTNNTISTVNVYAKGLALLYRTTTGTAPVPLVTKTTYYVTQPTDSSFKLSDTSTGSLNGIVIDITTQTQTGGGTFTLFPIDMMSGTFAFKLQASNDGENWSDIYISSVTGRVSFDASNSAPAAVSLVTPYTATSKMWDLGETYFSYLRVAFTRATWGALNLRAVLSGRQRGN